MSKAKKLKWRKVLGGYKAGPFAVYATDITKILSEQTDAKSA